jgi:uncharacterized protein DUF4185
MALLARVKVSKAGSCSSESQFSGNMSHSLPHICILGKRNAVLALSPAVILLLVMWPTERRRWENATTNPYAGLSAKPWEQADKLFRTDARWLGGDVAYSVDLGDGRVLWLFGDSFIASQPGARRGASVMVRNSVAVETGYDPSQASIKFYWRTRNKKPHSFFPEEGKVWLWPTGGVRFGGKLLLFVTTVRAESRKDSLGFENFGWGAFLVDNPEQEPSSWVLHRIEVPRNAWRVIVGAGALLADRWLYMFSPAERSHDVYLLRWPATATAFGKLSSPQWWCGPGCGWLEQGKLRRLPAPAFRGGQMEFSVQKDAQRSRFLEVQSVGFGHSDIAIRWASRVEGPWSDPLKVYHPPESDRSDAFVYAGKAHPELTGADLVLTYVANSNDFQILARDASIYYPRFVRLNFPSR